MPLILYTLYRLALLLAACGLLLWAGASLPVALLGAIVIASAVAYLALRGPRDAAAAWLASRAAARRARRAQGPTSAFGRRLAQDQSSEDAAAEDADDDAASAR